MKVQVVVLLGLLLLVGSTFAKHIEMDNENEDEDDNEKFDYDQPKSLEDEDEDEDKAQGVADKMFGHLSQLKEAIQSSEMSLGERSAALDNLNHIEHDAQAMRNSGSSSHKSHLQEAMKLRMQALKLQLHNSENNNNNNNNNDNEDENEAALEADNEDNDNDKAVIAKNEDNDDDEDDNENENNNNNKAMEQERERERNAKSVEDGDEDEDENENERETQKLEEEATARIAAKVSHDVEAVQSQLPSLHDARVSSLARENLRAIERDATRFASASSRDSELRSRLSEAMQLRVAALKLMLREEPKSSEAERVKQDMKNLEEKIVSSKMPKAKKHEAMANLKAMLHDAEEISNGVSESRNHQLKRALNLRMRALKQQLN